MELSEFLLERIAEDRAAAEALQGDPDIDPGRVEAHDTAVAAEWEFAERFTAAYVLLKCEAVWRAVMLHQEVTWRVLGLFKVTGCRTCHRLTKRASYPCPTMVALALPYRGHPEFRPEWKS